MKRSLKRNSLVAMGLLFLLGFSAPAMPEELTVVFSGQSYASLYPCDCGFMPDGGVARRATFIRDIRASSKNVLVVEAGASVGSGPEDENSQNEALDRARSDIYLSALEVMRYDAVLLDTQAFAFGEELVRKHKQTPFLSSNLPDWSPPRIVKDLGGLKVGILGVTGSSVDRYGVGRRLDPVDVLKKQVAELRKQGVLIVILLSAQEPDEDRALLARVKGIDIVINGSKNLGSVTAEGVEGAVYLKTFWQVRDVSVLNIRIKDGKIEHIDVTTSPLVADIADDPQVAALLPQCFADSDCKRISGMKATCQDGGSPQARCQYVTLPRVTLTVITPRQCWTCRTRDVINDLKGIWGEINIIEMNEDDPKAKTFIKDFQLTMLPAFIFHKDIEKSEAFDDFRRKLDEKNGYYKIKPEIAGVSYVLGRQRIPGRLDVFYDTRYPHLPSLFELLKFFSQRHPDVHMEVHFLAIRDKDKGFLTLGSPADIEEFKRVSCAAKLYPEKILDYLFCRAGQVDAGWWDECALKAQMDPAAIKSCALSDEAQKLLQERIRLTEELEIASGPTFIIDNVEIFGIVNVPSIEDFERTVRGMTEHITQE